MHLNRLKFCITSATLAMLLSMHSGTAIAGVALSDLLAGDSIVAGQTTFSNFTLVEDSGTISPNTSNITVNALTGVNRAGLFFDAGGEFTLAPGFDSIILQLAYDVETSGSVLDGETLSLFGRTEAGVEGLIDLTSTLDSNTGFVGEISAQIDPLFGIDEPIVSQTFAATDTLAATTSLTLFADANFTAPGDVLLDGFSQSFSTSAVPEPSSFTIALFGLASVLVRRRRR
ncbi:MAG: PEP-CTERM sorting domain-containing protein [Planctomycetota bacterium]